jgi:uncharacterized protein (DUF1697 family)
MPKYVAWLRGINVGGHRQIKMAALRQYFEDLEFDNVSTYINSGNVIFESSLKDTDKLRSQIEKHLEKQLGYDVPVSVRSQSDLASAIKKNPFAKVKLDENIMLYLSFFPAPPEKKEQADILASQLDGVDYRIIGADMYTLRDRRIQQKPLPDPKGAKKTNLPTSRNWNTVNKVLALMED